MRIAHLTFVLDAADADAESSFWATVLEARPTASAERHRIEFHGHSPAAIDVTSDHQPPDWPFGMPRQAHVDLWVDDPALAHDEVIGLGATLTRPADAGDGFQVYSDPAGHPFCICWAPAS